MGNNCSCVNTISEEKKTEGSKQSNSPVISKGAQILMGSLDSAPKYYVPQKPPPQSCYIIPEISVGEENNKSLIKMEIAYREESNRVVSLNEIDSLVHKVSNDSSSDFMGGSKRSISKRKMLRGFKTIKEGVTENIEQHPKVHPVDPKEIEMIVGYLEQHFVFGLIPRDSLYFQVFFDLTR